MITSKIKVLPSQIIVKSSFYILFIVLLVFLILNQAIFLFQLHQQSSEQMPQLITVQFEKQDNQTKQIETEMIMEQETVDMPKAQECFKHCELKIFVYPIPSKYHQGVLEKSGYWKLEKSLYLQYYHEVYLTDFFQTGGGWATGDLSFDWNKTEGHFSPQKKYRYNFITSNPEEADLFFVPLYAGMLEIEQSRLKSIGSDERPLDEAYTFIREYLNTFKDGYYFKRNHGKDHIMIQGYAWSFIYDKFPEPIMITQDYMWSSNSFAKDPDRMVTVPYIGHPTFNIQKPLWTKTKDLVMLPRKKFVTFIGGLEITWQRKPVRQGLQKALDAYDKYQQEKTLKPFKHYFENRGKFLDYDHTLQVYTDSTFCLVPCGDTSQSKRLFDVIFNLCIPVIISDDIALPFSDRVPYDDFAFFFPESEFRKFHEDPKTPLKDLLRPFHFLLNVTEKEIIRRRKLMLDYRQFLAFPPFVSEDMKENGNTEDGLSVLLDDLAWQAQRFKRWRGYQQRMDRMTHTNFT